MVIAVYFIAYLVPNAISSLVNASIPNAPAGITTILSTFIPIVTILGLALLLMPPEIKEYVS
jgi:hypothetical protein